MTKREMKTDHVLVFHHRIDLAHYMEHYMNHDQVQSMNECVQVLGFDGVLYKVLVAKLYPSYPGCIEETDGPLLPLLWRTKLAAAYRVEDNKLVEIPGPEANSIYLRISSDKSAALGEYLATIVPQFKVFSGRFGFQLGRKNIVSTE